MVNVPRLSYFFILGFIITIPYHPILIPPDLGLQTWLSSDLSCHLPSGKHTKNYGKSPFFMGKSTISMAMFNSYATNYQRVPL
jgi:hypothetical protein